MFWVKGDNGWRVLGFGVVFYVIYFELGFVSLGFSVGWDLDLGWDYVVGNILESRFEIRGVSEGYVFDFGDDVVF